MVTDNWIFPEEVKENGYYWFCDSSDGVILVEVVRMNLDWCKPEIAWFGTDDFEFIDDISGRFMGPLELPKPFWDK